MSKLVPSNDSTGIGIITVGAIGGLLALIAVICRLWSRRLVGAVLSWSDYTCILAIIIALTLVGSTVLTVIWGLGMDTAEVLATDPTKLINLGKGMFAGQILWITSNTLVRLSISFLYIDVFPVKRFQMACFALLAVNVAYFMAVLLQTVFICRPIAMNWNPNILGGKCDNVRNANFCIGIFNILIDFATILLPMPMLWSLQMPTGKKVGLTIVFGVGFIVCILTILRVHYIKTADLSNQTKSYASVGMLAILEPLLGIVNACLPVMVPLLKMFSRHAASWSNNNSHNTAEQSNVHMNTFHRMKEGSHELDSVANVTSSGTRVNFRKDVYGQAEKDHCQKNLIRVESSYHVQSIPQRPR